MNVAGIGCYPRKLDYARYSAVVHCTAVLHCTALHTVHKVRGDLVAAGEAHARPTRYSIMETFYS